MINRLPGTTIEIAVSDAAEAKSVLDNIFMCGGLTLSQVASLTGLEPYVIQNWVKRGFLAPPVKKLYTQRKFCRIAIINMLRNVLMIEKITDLLSFRKRNHTLGVIRFLLAQDTLNKRRLAGSIDTDNRRFFLVLDMKGDAL